MKLRTVSAVLSSAAAAAAFVLCSTAHAQAPETIVVVGGQPDVVYVDSSGNVVGASGGMNDGAAMSTTSGSLAPITVQGVSGDWVPGIDVPVVPGVVVRSDIMADRAIVKTRFGYVSVHTGAGARVLYKDQLVNWLTVPPGQVVQLPLSEIISGPVPHKLRVRMPETTVGMTGGMNGGMGMNPGTGGVGATVTTNGETQTITGSTTTTTTMGNGTGRRRRGRRNGTGTGTTTP